MKIVRLCAGLGNTMFQYCVYLQLKKMYKDEDILVDTSYYKLTGIPFELPKVLGNLVNDYDLNEQFINDSVYIEKLNKLKFWKPLGINEYKDMGRGDLEKIYIKLIANLSFIELPLLYKEWFKDLKIISPYGYSIENAMNKFLKNEIAISESKFTKVKHGFDQLLNKVLKGEAKLKYNVIKSPDVQKRFFKQLLKGKKPDWCYYGDTKLLKSEGDTYYNIYGSPCNLEGIEDDVRDAFRFSPFDDKNNIEMAKKIVETEAVAIHARVVNFEYGMKDCLDRNYYKKAVTYIKENLKTKPVFYIFSDDSNWCKSNIDILGLKDENVTFVDFNKGVNGFRDIQLMSLCKHIIIAKSTFSWWGGFLIKNPEKIFITPIGSWPGSISF